MLIETFIGKDKAELMKAVNEFLQTLEPEQYVTFSINPLLKNTYKDTYKSDDGTDVEDVEFEYEFTAMVHYVSKADVEKIKTLQKGIPYEGPELMG